MHAMEREQNPKSYPRINCEKLKAESDEKEKKWKEECFAPGSQAIEMPEEFKTNFKQLKKVRKIQFKEDSPEIDLVNINQKGKDGKTLLMQALYTSGFFNEGVSIPFIECLIGKGAKVDTQDKNNCGLIERAIRLGEFHVVPVFKKHGAHIPLPKKSTADEPPVIITAIHVLNEQLYIFSMMCRVLTEVMNKKVVDCCDCIRMLSDSGHNLDEEYKGETALIASAKTGLLPLVTLLLEKNASPEFLCEGKNALEWTQIEWDAEKKCCDFVISNKAQCAVVIGKRIEEIKKLKEVK